MDTLQLDTIYFTVKQDTTRMSLHGGVINGPKNPQIVFKSSFAGEIRNDDAELTLRYENAKGETGVLFGVNVRPLVEGKERRRWACFYADTGKSHYCFPKVPLRRSSQLDIPP